MKKTTHTSKNPSSTNQARPGNKKRQNPLSALLRRIKISQKIMFTTFLTLVLLCSIGIISITATKSMNEQTLYMETTMEKVNLYRDVKFTVNDIFEKLTALHYGASYVSTKDTIQVVGSSVKDIDSKLEKYAGYDLTTDESKKLKVLKGYLTTFNDNTNEYLALDGKDADAKEKLYQKIFDTKKKINLEMTKIFSVAATDAQAISKQTTKTYEETKKVIALSMVVALIISLLISSAIALQIARRLKTVVVFAKEMGKGDLTKQMHVLAEDEIGMMAHSLNEAITNMNALITTVISGANELNHSGTGLSAISEELLATMETVKDHTVEITHGASDLGASSEEVNASMGVINEKTEELRTKAEMQERTAEEIKCRASVIKTKGLESEKHASKMYDLFNVKLKEIVEKTHIVDDIAKMAKAIEEIAAQTNLLSLNASIEAARAGEHGRGFAVVASEIRALAEQSNNSASNIKSLTALVKEAFTSISTSSGEILKFLNTEVKANNMSFIEAGKSYEQDAKLIQCTAEEFKQATAVMAQTINEICIAMEGVTITAQKSIVNTGEIMHTMAQSADAVNEVTAEIQKQSELIGQMSKLTGKFKV